MYAIYVFKYSPSVYLLSDDEFVAKFKSLF